MLLAFSSTKRHVIKITPGVWIQEYHRYIDLGKVFAEAMVDSPEACGRLCEENPVCASVILVGKLCRLLTKSHCLVCHTF